MSLKSWISEFCPRFEGRYSDRKAVEHGIMKWVGCRPEHLDRHGIRRIGRQLLSPRGVVGFDLGAKSCALCMRYLTSNCRGCPLRDVLRRHCDYGPDSPWRQVLSTLSDVEPMIVALQLALRRVIRRQRRTVAGRQNSKQKKARSR